VSQPDDPGAGRNPEYGASLHYNLKGEPEGGVKISILDESGEEVRRLDSVQSEPGLNRVHWDLRYEASETPKMRTKVLEHSHVPIGDDGWRPAGETGRVAPLASPGEYVVRLIVGDEEFTQRLVVLKDPGSTGSEADIRTQLKVLLELRDEANAVVDLINEAESVRDQVMRLSERLRDMEGSDEVLAAAQELDQRLVDFEMTLTDLRMSGGTAGQDRLRWPRQLYAKITSLAGYIGGSDFVPTTQQLEVHERLQGLLQDAQDQMRALREQDIAAFNDLLAEKGIPHVGGSGIAESRERRAES